MVGSSKNKRVFGQATKASGPPRATRYQRQQGNGGSSSIGGSGGDSSQLTEEQAKAQRRLQQKLKRRAEDEAFDEQHGYQRFHRGSNGGDSITVNSEMGIRAAVAADNPNSKHSIRQKRGWVFNMLPTVSGSWNVNAECRYLYRNFRA